MTSLPGWVSSSSAVRVHTDSSKTYSVMAFNAGDNVDCSRWTRARMEREPEEGEGRDGAAAAGKKRRQRRKRTTTTSDLKAEDQPWILNVKGTAGKKKFKGQKKAGVMDNASYYVFRRRADDGSFDAFPVRGGWYAFTPQAKHRTLTGEEAEAEWARRNKVLNHFSIMMQRRLSDRCGEEEEEEGRKGGKRKNCVGGGGDLRITDLVEDPGMSSDDSDDSSMGGDGEGKSSKVKNGKEGRKKKKRKEKKEGSDLDEAVEDSDDGDGEGLEVEYMTDQSSSSEEEEEEEEEGPNKPDKGEQLPKGIDEASESEEESEEEEEKGRKTPVQLGEKTKEKHSSGESDSSDDSDIEEAASALFMAKAPSRHVPTGDRGGSSRPGTSRPRSIDSACSTLRGFAASQSEQQGKKRQPPSGAGTDTPAAKRLRMEPDDNSQSPAAASGSSGGMQGAVALQLPASGEPTRAATGVTGDLLQLTEEVVRRYLLRKPMTTRDLLRKFHTQRTGMNGTQTVNALAHVLKRLAPQRRNVNGTVHFYLTE